MLVLSRKEGESLWIGPTIRITVIKSTGTTVRIGIEAPADFKVLRDELIPADWTSMVPDPSVLDPSVQSPWAQGHAPSSGMRNSDSRTESSDIPNASSGIPISRPMVASSVDLTSGGSTICRAPC